MVSSEAKTLSFQRLLVEFQERTVERRRCNDNVFASLDRIALARGCRWARSIRRFVLTGFAERRLGICQRRSNNRFERTMMSKDRSTTECSRVRHLAERCCSRAAQPGR